MSTRPWERSGLLTRWPPDPEALAVLRELLDWPVGGLAMAELRWAVRPANPSGPLRFAYGAGAVERRRDVYASGAPWRYRLTPEGRAAVLWVIDPKKHPCPEHLLTEGGDAA